MKTILVLGAQGMLGRFTALRLRTAGFNVLRGGRRFENATDFRLVDLDRIETLNSALLGVDLVVSSIEDPEVRAELEILRRGGVLISQSTVPTVARRRLDAEAARGANGMVVLNSGLTGVMGLAVKDLLDCHPEADTVEIGFIASVIPFEIIHFARRSDSLSPTDSIVRNRTRGLWRSGRLAKPDHLVSEVSLFR